MAHRSTKISARNDPLAGFETRSISASIRDAQYNPAGVAMTSLAEYAVGGRQMRKLLVSLQPGKGVGVHLHERGGESQLALTPVRGIFGIAIKNQDGEFDINRKGQVGFEVVENRIYTPDDVTSIPAGLVHGYGNPSTDKEAHIIFDLPLTHANASDKLLADPETTMIGAAISVDDYESYAKQLPLRLAAVPGHLGHMACGHGPEQG